MDGSSPRHTARDCHVSDPATASAVHQGVCDGINAASDGVWSRAGCVRRIGSKGNLLAIVLGTLLAATRVNLAIATSPSCSAASVQRCSIHSLISVGVFVQTNRPLQGMFTEMINTPFMPWTDFNNSIVMGSFVTD